MISDNLLARYGITLLGVGLVGFPQVVLNWCGMNFGSSYLVATLLLVAIVAPVITIKKTD